MCILIELALEKKSFVGFLGVIKVAITNLSQFEDAYDIISISNNLELHTS